MQTAIVTSPDGGKVNLRVEPAKHASHVNQLAPGTEVEIVKNLGEWCYVTSKKGSGYIMTKFLDFTEAEGTQTEPPETQDNASAAPDNGDVTAWLYKALEANEEERRALVMLQELLPGAVG